MQRRFPLLVRWPERDREICSIGGSPQVRTIRSAVFQDLLRASPPNASELRITRWHDTPVVYRCEHISTDVGQTRSVAYSAAKKSDHPQPAPGEIRMTTGRGEFVSLGYPHYRWH